MKDRNFSEVFYGNFLTNWNRLSTCKKPVIAAVNGFAVSSCRHQYTDRDPGFLPLFAIKSI